MSCFSCRFLAPLACAVFLAAATPARAQPLVAVLGDSLATGYGLDPSESWPLVLRDAARHAGFPVTVRTFARDGATMAWGRSSVLPALELRPAVLVVALGGNDLLTSRPVEEISSDLAFVLDAARDAGVPVLLCGMRAPPEWPTAARLRFEEVWQRPAAARRLWFVHFLLEGVARVPAMNQPDGIHPNAAGARQVAANVWAGLREILSAPPR